MRNYEAVRNLGILGISAHCSCGGPDCSLADRTPTHFHLSQTAFNSAPWACRQLSTPNSLAFGLIRPMSLITAVQMVPHHSYAVPKFQSKGFLTTHMPGPNSSPKGSSPLMPCPKSSPNGSLPLICRAQIPVQMVPYHSYAVPKFQSKGFLATRTAGQYSSPKGSLPLICRAQIPVQRVIYHSHGGHIFQSKGLFTTHMVGTYSSPKGYLPLTRWAHIPVQRVIYHSHGGPIFQSKGLFSTHMVGPYSSPRVALLDPFLYVNRMDFNAAGTKGKIH
jgi:hypothetical protein